MYSSSSLQLTELQQRARAASERACELRRVSSGSIEIHRLTCRWLFKRRAFHLMSTHVRRKYECLHEAIAQELRAAPHRIARLKIALCLEAMDKHCLSLRDLESLSSH